MAGRVAYRRAMMAVADKYPVRFQGGPVFYPGANPALTHTPRTGRSAWPRT